MMIRQAYIRNASMLLVVAVFFAYFVGQIFIGTYLPASESFHFDAPADGDFLYYAGIINQLKVSFPPQNPAYGGVPLSQSFISYYPAVLLSWLFNPYLSMKILNLIYLVIFALVMRRYFISGWQVGLTVIVAGSVGFGLVNSLGVDLVARGFNHFPFFIALLFALFEKKNRFIRYASLFALGWLHSYSAAIIAIYLFGRTGWFRFNKSDILDSIICLAGLATALSLAGGVADKPFYFPLVEGVGVDLSNLWMHALAMIIPVLWSRKMEVYLLFVTSFIIGCYFHYNPFFPVFLIYFSGGWGLAVVQSERQSAKLAPVLLAGLLFIGFVAGSYDKYNPLKGAYQPILDDYYLNATQWIDKNCPNDAVILTVPNEAGKVSRLMEVRAVYLGAYPHVAHLGLDWEKRGEKIVDYFLNPAVHIDNIDYLLYGPLEQGLFPNFYPGRPPIFDDGNVKIWKNSH